MRVILALIMKVLAGLSVISQRKKCNWNFTNVQIMSVYLNFTQTQI